MAITIQDLVEELNVVAEYAKIRYDFVEVGPTSVSFLGETFEVDLTWAMGNVKGLPDRVKASQMVHALRMSHPSIKGIGPTRPVRE